MSDLPAPASSAERRTLLENLLGSAAPRPLSFAQERLYFIEKLTPGTGLYNIPSYFETRAEVDPRVLDRTLQEIARRHQILRTRFFEARGRPLHQVVPNAEIVLDVDDLRGLPAQEEVAMLERISRWNAETPFDLSQAPLMRARLARCAGGRNVLFWCVHHMCSDAWSAGIFLRELAQIYDAFARNAPSPLPELVVQYADFAEWQRNELSGPRLEQLLTYWRTALEGAPQTVSLPADRRRPRATTYRGAVVTSVLGREATEMLSVLAREARATLFMILHAAFAVFVHRLASIEDIVIGAPIANRDLNECENLIGFFVNTVVLRTKPDGEASFRAFLDDMREIALSAFDHKDVPFEKIVDSLHLDRSLWQNPVFQLMLVVQDSLASGDDSSGSIGGTTGGWAAPIGNGTSKFDVTVFASASPRGLDLAWEFSTDLYDHETMARYAAMFEHLLRQIAVAPNTRIRDFELTDEDERRRLAALSVGAGMPPNDLTADQMFRLCAARAPERDAIIAPDRVMTYGELDEASDRIATAIHAAYEGTDPVAVFLPRGWRAVVALMGVLKSGRPYVPLDPSYPGERLAYMLRNSGACLVVAIGATDFVGVPAIEFDAALRTAPAPAPAGERSPLAYIIYTSGSTGHPKGVAMRHSALSNLIEWQIQSEGGAARRTYQFSPLGFDVSAQEIFTTLAAGGALVVGSDDTRTDFQALWRDLVDRKVERLFLPYVALQALAELNAGFVEGSRLALVITAGEQLYITDPIVRMFRALGAELRNQYGPTETHVVTELVLRGNPADWPLRPSIGRPVANCEVHVVDRYGRLCPSGVPGEIWIGGAQLSPGYRNAPELTEAAFRAGSSPEVRGLVYCSGDLGRFCTDGSIEFLGRKDDQTKIRGHRVEPAECTAVLLRHPTVSQAVVVVEKTRTAGDRLAAYLMLKAGASTPSREEFVGWCSKTLPDYLVPFRFTVVDDFPRTPSGKVALQELSKLAQPESPDQEPDRAALTPIELELLAMVEEVTELVAVSIEANFFSIGGHSLLAMRLVALIRDRFQLELPVGVLFEHPVLNDLAVVITDRLAAEGSTALSLLSEIEAMDE